MTSWPTMQALFLLGGPPKDAERTVLVPRKDRERSQDGLFDFISLLHTSVPEDGDKSKAR